MPSRPPEPLPPQVWKIAVAVAFGPFLSNLDATVVNVSLSTLGADLGAPLSTIQWVMSAYLLALALMLPLTGWLVERIGARQVYLGCFVAFTLASGLCGLATSAPALIAFRVLQGMAGGLMAPMAQLMIARHAGAQMPRVLGWIILPVLLGPILGPVLAGFILLHASWRWLFLLNLPVGVVALALSAWLLPRGEPLRPRPLDWLGFGLLSPALVFLLDGCEALAAGRGDAGLRVLELAASGGCFLAFLGHGRRRGARALIDLGLFGRPLFRTAAATQFSANALLLGGQFLVPLFLVTGRGLPPLTAGLVIAPMGLGIGLASLRVGALMERVGPRRAALTGTLLALAGTLPFCLPSASGSLGLMAGALFVRGLGLGCVSIPAMTSAYSGVAPEELPGATTAINIVQRLGGPVGTTALAMWLPHVERTVGFAPGFWVLAGFNLLCGVSAARLPSRMPAHASREPAPPVGE